VANRTAFRVEALQDTQWPSVVVTRHTAPGLQAVVKIQSGMPSHKTEVFVALKEFLGLNGRATFSAAGG